MKEFLNKVFMRYGWIKAMISCLLGGLSILVYEKTGIESFGWAAYPFLIYFVGFIVVMILFAWIINPITALVKRRKAKNDKKS